MKKGKRSTGDAPEDGNLLGEFSPTVIATVFDRVGSRTATPREHDIFHACILQQFVNCVGSDSRVEPWIMSFLAESFAKVLAGSEWNDEIALPGRPTTTIRSFAEQRRLEIFCFVSNQLRARPSLSVTKSLKNAALEFCVSYESARFAYYEWAKRFPDVLKETENFRKKRP